jgi:hypothetical protein
MQHQTETQPAETHCLNLHENYARNWGVWEVARELYANAQDASPDGLRIESHGPDDVTISTPTVPDIAQLFIIGCGSKDGSATIGQFGEGLKLAALVATRNPDASLTLTTPDATIWFEMRPHLGHQVLFAHVTPDGERREGYTARLCMAGAGDVLGGRIIDGKQSRCIPKALDETCRIFCRGVWICDLKAKTSLHSYNLNNLTLNRDRSMAASYAIAREVVTLLNERMDAAMADKIVGNLGAWESKECLDDYHYHVGEGSAKHLAEAFTRRYGPMAVVSTDLKCSNLAAKRGYRPIPMGDGLQRLLCDGGAPRDADMITGAEDLEPVEHFDDDWRPMIEELMALAGMVGVASVTVKVFEDDFSTMGMALPSLNLVWLNRSLMQHDNRFERVRTFLHELAHIASGATDESAGFEVALDSMLASLAIMAIDG